MFTVLTGPFRLYRVLSIGDGPVIEPNHADGARVPITDDNEVACFTELLDSPFRIVSESF